VNQVVSDHPSIPLIDLDAQPRVEQIRQACLSAGCFNVKGGGLNDRVTRDLLEKMTGFFGLPDNHPIKQAVHRNQNSGANGWSPMLEEPAYEAGTIAWVESFDCVLSRERLSRLPGELQEKVVPSIWPEISRFRDTVRIQWDLLISAAHGLYPLVSCLLKQHPGFLAEHASSQALNTLRLLNYPSRPQSDDERSRGISAHTDFECITLISQDAPGLEVQTPSGKWIQVPVEPGQWTVLLGDMVERWSNGVYKATPHRVPTTSWPRRSIVMFVAADSGCSVEPLDEFVTASNPAKFERMTQDELIRMAMARAESNRLQMAPEIQKLRSAINRD